MLVASRSKKILDLRAPNGGWGGIRTHGTLAGTPVFKTGALNHSATLPNFETIQPFGAAPRTNQDRNTALLPLCYPTSQVRLFMAARNTPSTAATASPC